MLDTKNGLKQESEKWDEIAKEMGITEEMINDPKYDYLEEDSYICNDRIDIVALGEKINAMTNEEFEAHCQELKQQEKHSQIDIGMEWNKIKNRLISHESNLSEEVCPECGGNLQFSFDEQSGSYTIQCKKCWTIIRGH